MSTNTSEQHTLKKSDTNSESEKYQAEKGLQTDSQDDLNKKSLSQIYF